MIRTWQARLGVWPSASTEWGWVTARALVGLAAAIVTVTSASGAPSFVPTLTLVGLFLAYDAVLAIMLLHRLVWLAFVVGVVLDNAVIVGGWWWTSFVSRGESVEAGDLYLVLFPLLILGTARLGWKLGILQMTLWIGVMAVTGLLYMSPESYTFQQLPIRIPLLAITGAVTLQLVSWLTTEKERAQRSEFRLQQSLLDLQRSERLLMEQERMRVVGEMAVGIAHDINNAANPIVGYAELLLSRSSDMPPEQRRQLELILRSGQDIVAIVERLRHFSQRREGDGEANELPVQLNKVVEEAVELGRLRFARALPGASVTVETALEPGLPTVPGNEAEFREALLNLVINAADAMPAGGRLTLRTYVAPPGEGATDAGRRVAVEVIDTGVGMDEETRERALQMFFTTKGASGTGMGLSMVLATVERYGGRLAIESEPGRGTTVRLLFPTHEGGVAP